MCGQLYCGPEWSSEEGWNSSKQTAAYQQVKQVAQVLQVVSPGLVGTTQTGIINTELIEGTGPGKLLAKNGTDGKLYLFVVNQSDNNQRARISNIPSTAWGIFKEIITNSTVDASSGSFDFNNPHFGVRIFVQEKDQNITLTGQPILTITPRSSELLPSCPRKNEGDANCDGKVDLYDYFIWQKEFTFKLPAPKADFNDTGKVTLVDYEIWRRSYYH